MFWKKKDKRYNSYFDNYSNKLLDSIIGGLIFGAIIFVIYLIAQFFI